MFSLKLMALILVFLLTLISGAYPFFKKIKTQQIPTFPIGESLAVGVFLGASLMEMLADATRDFYRLDYHYPFAFLIAGLVFLLFLWLEHVGRKLYQERGAFSNAFAILATVMLSIHSFFTGTALGLGDSVSVVLMILFAILAHKWAVSFSLSVQITRSQLSFPVGLALFLTFSFMVPLGIIFGSAVSARLDHYGLIEPVFSAIAAGTLLYLGTLHGLEKATLVKHHCGLHRFYYVILGFLLMAGVAIWS